MHYAFITGSTSSSTSWATSQLVLVWQITVRLCQRSSISDHDFRVRCSSRICLGSAAVLAVCVTDRQRHCRSWHGSLTVRWWHSAVYFTRGWKSSLIAVSVFQVSSLVVHVERIVAESRQVWSHHHRHRCSTTVSWCDWSWRHSYSTIRKCSQSWCCDR